MGAMRALGVDALGVREGSPSWPWKSLPTLDALHLATFVLAREKIEGLELETVDGRLQAALEAV